MRNLTQNVETLAGLIAKTTIVKFVECVSISSEHINPKVKSERI
jgi:hypothetical protein